jgi:G3E family GTPase
VNGPRNLDDQVVALRQAAVADRRLITKSDLAEPRAIVALEERLRAVNPGAPVRRVSFGAIDANELFGASLYDHATGRADIERWLGIGGHHDFVLRPHRRHDIRFSGGPDRDDVIGTWLVEEEGAVEWATLSPLLGAIVARHGESLLRLKGVIRTADDPRPLVIHGVQRLFHSPVRLERWTTPPATTIVAIGDRGAAPAIEGIRAALDTAIEAASQAARGRATEVDA